MEWLLFLSQIPSNPSSLRVNIWRKLKSSGAVGLNNGIWILPHNPKHIEFLENLIEKIQNNNASGYIFTVSTLNNTIEKEIILRFKSDREEEYKEFFERSEEFLAEIEKETKNQKFTFAELEENEQDLQRLKKWLEKIQKRDFLGGDIAQKAINKLSLCQKSFNLFSTEVYNQNKDEFSIHKI